MATTQNTYTGDGSTTNYSFTFEYIKQADVKVTLAAAATTAFTFANATTLSFNTAPANGAAIRIYRDTDITNLNATFFPGSAIKAEDLNNNFTQTHFATQETDNEVSESNVIATAAKTTAETALTNSAAAVTSANAAVTTANTSDTNASQALTTANAADATATTAETNAAAAVVTANNADTTAGNAVTTANSAVTTANNAVSSATTANTTAGNAVTTANNAVATANSAVTTANAADATATTADTNASNAVTTANSATTTANTAETNAAAAVVTANAASAAASLAVSFSLVGNVASIPTNPADQDRIEIGNSVGLGSFTPLTGVPSGFVGNSGLSVRLEYDLTNTTWVWMNYFANDSEDRYVSKEYTSANMPTGSTAERPSIPAAGMLRFNSTEVEFEGYDGFAWGAIGGGLVTIDAGNFNTGGTLVTTEEIYDGGSFD
jgi:chemotaxis protein histidine kinase CheA